MANTNTGKTILLVMDIQKQMMGFIADPAPLLTKVAEAIAHARAAGIEVIYLVLSFRNGYPEVSARNKSFSRVTQSGGMFTEGNEGTAVHDAVAPQQGELVLAKKRVSAFAGSELEMILKAKGIENLVLSGFATSGIVLNTVREGADKDYAITVLSDACGDSDLEKHTFLTEKIFPMSGDVMTTEEWGKAVK